MIDPVTITTGIEAVKVGSEIANKVAGQNFMVNMWHILGQHEKANELSIMTAEVKAFAESVYDLEKEKGKIRNEANLRNFSRKINEWEVEFQNQNDVLEKASRKIDPEQIGLDNKNVDSIRELMGVAKKYSDKDVQEFIAQAIAQEYNEPNSVSMQTIDILQKMGKKDFELFNKYLGLVIEQKSIQQDSQIIVSDFIEHDNKNKKESDWKYSPREFLYLQELGLINPIKLEYFKKNWDSVMYYIFSYFDGIVPTQ